MDSCLDNDDKITGLGMCAVGALSSSKKDFPTNHFKGDHWKRKQEKKRKSKKAFSVYKGDRTGKEILNRRGVNGTGKHDSFFSGEVGRTSVLVNGDPFSSSSS
eukprot:Hpha_TRINITY_DN16321_c2_g1::TRINITY_DN16321_c2_g1_i1::g.57762::m.57762